MFNVNVAPRGGYALLTVTCTHCGEERAYPFLSPGIRTFAMPPAHCPGASWTLTAELAGGDAL